MVPANIKSFSASHTWISPSTRGEGPEAREGHSAALVGKRLFIFGGCGKSVDNNIDVYYNDLYILNTGNFVLPQCLLLIKLQFMPLISMQDFKLVVKDMIELTDF